MLKSILETYRQLFVPDIYDAVDAEDLPHIVNEKKIYIVGEKEHKWLAVMICPCGCLEIIQLNLLKEADPCWKIKFHKNRRITLKPSVWRIKGCRSHFRLINGKIEWC